MRGNKQGTHEGTHKGCPYGLNFSEPLWQRAYFGALSRSRSITTANPATASPRARKTSAVKAGGRWFRCTVGRISPWRSMMEAMVSFQGQILRRLPAMSPIRTAMVASW